MYLAQENGLDSLPDAVKKQLGDAEFAMSLELTPERKLGQEDTAKVMQNLAAQGFHIQMPRDIDAQLANISMKATSGSSQPE